MRTVKGRHPTYLSRQKSSLLFQPFSKALNRPSQFALIPFASAQTGSCTNAGFGRPRRTESAREGPLGRRIRRSNVSMKARANGRSWPAAASCTWHDDHHPRTAATAARDPLLPVEPPEFQRQISERSGHSIPSIEDKASAPVS
jgi:hypothetical protein